VDRDISDYCSVLIDMLTFEGPFEWKLILAETPGGKVGYMVRDEET